jgi:flagellar basal body P-ring formation protein FlgA
LTPIVAGYRTAASILKWHDRCCVSSKPGQIGPNLQSSKETKMKIAMCITIATAALPTASSAQQSNRHEYEDIAALDDQVASFITRSAQGKGSSIVPIDRRLKLARCPQTPVIDPPALGAVAVRCLALGWRIRVGLVEQTQTFSAVSDNAIAVRRGDAVELIIGGDGFDVSASGVALDDGAVGKSIRVKMPTGKNPLTAMVRGAGAVEILN